MAASHPESLKSAAITLVASGLSYAQAARELEVTPESVRTWCARAHVAEQEMVRDLDTIGAQNNQQKAYQGIVARSAAAKIDLIAKITVVVDKMLDRVLDKVEDANLSELVSAIDDLLTKVESLTFRPAQEERQDRLVDTLLDRSNPEHRERVQAAVVETLRRRGALPGAADADDRIEG